MIVGGLDGLPGLHVLLLPELDRKLARLLTHLQGIIIIVKIIGIIIIAAILIIL